MMGQSQSSKNQPASNYGPRPPVSHKKHHDKSSPKGSHSHKSGGSTSRSPKEKSKGRLSYPQGHSHSGSSEERSSSVSYSSRPYEPPASTRVMSVGHSLPEKSVPVRQFSLERQTSGGSGTQVKHAQIEKYFNRYRDEVEDAILAEGVEKFCVDLGVDPTEYIVLVLAWKFKASQMCRFTREEFLNGCQKMRAHDARSLKERFPELVAEVREEKNFKELYNFTFSFGLDHSTGQRTLPVDLAIPLWDLVFAQNRPKILQSWFDFLKTSEVRGISRDTWNMFLPFSSSVKIDFSNYDESEAWPSLFDDFVEHQLGIRSG